MITTLAWNVLGILKPPPGGHRARIAPLGRFRSGSNAWHDVWLPGELCKLRNPRIHRLGFCAVLETCHRAIMFRETIFRGMDVPARRIPERGPVFGQDPAPIKRSRYCPPDSTPSTAKSSKSCRTTAA